MSSSSRLIWVENRNLFEEKASILEIGEKYSLLILKKARKYLQFLTLNPKNLQTLTPNPINLEEKERKLRNIEEEVEEMARNLQALTPIPRNLEEEKNPLT